jgi:hypothetical protein
MIMWRRRMMMMMMRRRRRRWRMSMHVEKEEIDDVEDDNGKG